MKKAHAYVLLYIFILLSACGPTKRSQVTNNLRKGATTCDKPIKYIIKKIKMIDNGNEVNVDIKATFNPITKIISVEANDPEEGETKFDTEIETIDCNLSESLSSGQAIYKGYIKQKDGTKTFTSLLIEVKDGQIYIKSADENDRGEYDMIVDRWEIVE